VLGNRAATVGYRLQTADQGPLGSRSTLDLPFAVYCARESLLRSQMIHQASEYDFREMGDPGGFAFGGTTGSTGLPTAPSPRLSGLGAPWAGMQARTRLLEVAVRQRVTDDLGLEAGILQQIADREFHNMMTHTFTDDAGDYATTYRQSGSRGDVLSNKLYLNGALATGFVRHQIALGTNGFRAEAYSKPQVASGTLSLGPGSLSSPVLGSELKKWPAAPGACPELSRGEVHFLASCRARRIYSPSS
jgi:hypothetical protein